MRSYLARFHYKELFLVGFYLSFIGITSFAAVIDYAVGKSFDARMDLLFVVLGTGFYLFFLKTRNRRVASSAMLWIASTIVFVFMISNGFDMSIIFSLMLPMVAFVLMSPREIMVNMTLYYLVLGGLFAYGYLHYEYHPILHSAAKMSVYLIALLFVIAFGIVYHFAIEQSYRDLQQANRQKEILLKEIHHRIKNNLNIISAILGLQKFDTDDAEVHRIIDQNKLRIESMSLAHEVLYGTDDLSHIEFGDYAKRLVEHILAMSDLAGAIELKLESAAAAFSLERMVQLGIIMNELVTNSVKYAFAERSGGIEMSLAEADGTYTLRYRDSGPGVPDPAAFMQGETLGLSLVRLTVEQMHGGVRILGGRGLEYEIRFAA